VTQKKEVRNARYVFNDNYFNFWFRYVYPYKSLIEEGRAERLFDSKWSDLELGEASRILAGLEEKAENVDWNNEIRKEHFGLIGKRVEGKANLRGEGYPCYDLEDMQKKRIFH